MWHLRACWRGRKQLISLLWTLENGFRHYRCMNRSPACTAVVLLTRTTTRHHGAYCRTFARRCAGDDGASVLSMQL
jgi:hypothetical protein